MNWIIIITVFMGGVAVAVQASINGGLGKQIGVIEGAFLSFLIGTVSLLIIMLLFGKGNVFQVSTVPKWQLIGGILGAFYVYTMVLSVPKIGVAAALVTVIAAQLIASSLIDHFGLLGMKQIPIDGQRIVGFILLLAALFLITKK
ncbi:DMT family transporter [Pseudalkalibacillus sp. SCS-8]|uniref:DMT family transporter n=1 Tax=Pseudalkalibacillus nanhaiensis TaxID=3115291 RepID=UPI0032DBC492